MKLEICIHCYNYQKRLCWMLSSILQQIGNIPEIVVSISYSPDNGNPTTENIIKLFREKGLNIVDVVLTKEQASNRAIPRSLRMEKTEADWILFADCDMVYESTFFEELKNKLETDDYKNETKVIGADRHSLDEKFCIKYFEEDKREYPCIIENVSKIPIDFPLKWITGKDTCAGYFQLARVQSVRERNQVYSGRKRDCWRRTKSDREFRVRCGGRVPLLNFSSKQYHLNHDRGGPEIQR